MKRHVIFILSLILSLTSCTPIYMKMYGMKSPETITDEKIAEFSENYDIPLADSYKLDTSYVTFLYSLDTVKYKYHIKNYLQPLQALYYDKSGQLQSFQINCYAGGYPNLKWDRNEVMTTFPPKEQAPIDSILPLNIQLKYIQQLPDSKDISTEEYDYIVFVHWNRFMGRQSKRLIQAVKANAKLAENQKVKIIYVNTDAIFAY